MDDEDILPHPDPAIGSGSETGADRNPTQATGHGTIRGFRKLYTILAATIHSNPHYQRIFDLHFRDGHDFKSIARELGIKEQAASDLWWTMLSAALMHANDGAQQDADLAVVLEAICNQRTIHVDPFELLEMVAGKERLSVDAALQKANARRNSAGRRRLN